MLFALACFTIAAMVGLTLVKEPQGGLRNFYKILFGFAYAGDGSVPMTPMQRMRRLAVSLIAAIAGLFFLLQFLKSL